MMRAFCSSNFSISATCVRIHNLETKLGFLFFPHDFFQNHLFVKPSHHPMQYHVVNVVCKFHIIIMHASEDMLFEKMYLFLSLAAILSTSSSQHILVRTSMPRCLCEIDAGPPPLCLPLSSYRTCL